MKSFFGKSSVMVVPYEQVINSFGHVRRVL